MLNVKWLLCCLLLIKRISQACGFPPPSFGEFSTMTKSIVIPGLQQGSNYGYAVWPQNASAGQQFPLISFSHGDFGGGPFIWVYTTLLEQIASFGFVVIAHASCFPTCDNAQYLDQLRVLDWASQMNSAGNATTHPVLRWVDFTVGFGVSGHSTGGRATFQSGVVATKHRIRAGVAINPDPKVDSASNVTECAIAVFTGTNDSLEPKGSALADFLALPRPKVYANMTGESHITPISSHPKWGPYAAAWFKVYINGDRGRFYNLIFGEDSESLCGGGYPMTDCIRRPE